MSSIRTDKKLLYIHIPRTAGTSMQSCSFIGGSGHKTIHYFRELVSLGLLEGINLDEYFKFAFVRNPFEKLVSGFSFIGGKKEDFEYFVRNQLNTSLPMFKPQYEYICDSDGNLLVDFVGRFEQLGEDWKVVCRIVGVLEDLPNHRASIHDSYQSYYNPELIEIVTGVYQKDLQIFNYEY